ncbi:VOC family protein [Rubrimonas cliftonensis]|uniref:Uncharacterized conserved protein PhnB, glyoxalase superfamily n=1 Tax=Rubrimonas cliftonensis TaxID=89524 RepID=A0A1H4FZI4_9RHOB|nr:VOC family protein [Rubrimonas cliftonensis]SEB02735.1 Uncharacterized conserved protein PhnB, glyoxalase superfamily [Rubrimonas cliftonensis]
MIREVFAYLRASPAAEAVAFYARAFGAVEKFRLTAPDGRIGHVELLFSPATIMLSDPFPEFDIRGPEGGGATIHLDVADAVIAQAVAAGATLVRPAAEQFYGERTGTVRDPFGHEWMIGHAIEQVEPAEMQRRHDSLSGNWGHARNSSPKLTGGSPTLRAKSATVGFRDEPPGRPVTSSRGYDGGLVGVACAG